jgi:hypothetical protein
MRRPASGRLITAGELARTGSGAWTHAPAAGKWRLIAFLVSSATSVTTQPTCKSFIVLAT